MQLKGLFTKNLSPGQKQYEALRALAFEEGPAAEIAGRFGYAVSTLRTLASRAISGEHVLFPEVKRGPRGRRVAPETQKMICTLRRKEKLNSRQIAGRMKTHGVPVSIRTVERILAEAGFPKLHRRTRREIGIGKKGTVTPERTVALRVETLAPFRTDCPVAGVFFFLPYILESGLLNIVDGIPLPGSSGIGPRQAALSMLLLKLLGQQRLSHIDQYNTERGFGLFAGLNVPPKPTYMTTWSCRADAEQLSRFQKEVVAAFAEKFPPMYEDRTINLDFHSIPHYGEEAEMEKIWCGSRNKTMRGANTFFAQAGERKTLLYANAGIRRREASLEIQRFIAFWLELKGVVRETLVFDSKLTRYDILQEMDDHGIKFITLRRRGNKLTEEALLIPETQWRKVCLNIPKRKYRRVQVHESQLYLKGWTRPLRQVIIKGHGRAEPTFIITNNRALSVEQVLETYARRWRIENKFSELVNFFSLNSLSSPVMIRIHFDLLWTIIADTLYHRFSQDLPGYEKALAPRIFRNFINTPGMITYDGKEFLVKIRKRGNTPILAGVKKLKGPISIPWLGKRPLKIVWTA